MPMCSADEQTLLRHQGGILSRWAEHFVQLLNVRNPTDPSALNDLPLLSMLQELDRPPTPEKVSHAIESLKLVMDKNCTVYYTR